MALKERAMEYMEKNSEENLLKLLQWLETFDIKRTLREQTKAVRAIISDMENNWRQLIMSLWTEIDPAVRNTLFENFIINASLLGYQKQCENKENYGCNIPWAILMNPTSACNFQCTDCWTAKYGDHMNLTYEELDEIVN